MPLPIGNFVVREAPHGHPDALKRCFADPLGAVSGGGGGARSPKKWPDTFARSAEGEISHTAESVVNALCVA